MSLSERWIDTPILDCPRLAAHFTSAATKYGHMLSLGIFRRLIALNVALDTMDVLAILAKSQMSKTNCWLLPPPHFLQKSSCAGTSVDRGGCEDIISLAILL